MSTKRKSDVFISCKRAFSINQWDEQKSGKWPYIGRDPLPLYIFINSKYLHNIIHKNATIQGYNIKETHFTNLGKNNYMFLSQCWWYADICMLWLVGKSKHNGSCPIQMCGIVPVCIIPYLLPHSQKGKFT